MFNLVLLIASVLIATAASAHRGHGQSTGLAHYFIEPLHVLGSVAVGLALVVGVRTVRRRRARTTP